MIGGFAGLCVSGAAASSLFDFGDSGSSMGGFAAVITGTATGSLIGYYKESKIEYRFELYQNKK